MNNQDGFFANNQNLIYDSHDLTVGENEYLANTKSRSINTIDYERLNRQNALLNPCIGLFPNGYIPSVGHRILDVACGPGGWICEVARGYPGVQLIGIDNNKLAINHARQDESSNKNPHVFFELADIMQSFHCPDNVFDFVNIRFLTGVVPRDRWGGLILECFRVLKPGGCIRIVEAEVAVVACEPDSKIAQTVDFILDMLWTYGKSFARHSMSVVPMLPVFLQASQFQNIQIQPYLLNWSYGQVLHKSVSEDFVVAIHELRELFLRNNTMTEDQYEDLLHGYITEVNLPSHYALWPVNSVHAYKPM